jgi:uncharacterized protein (DUF2141 family)
MNGEMETFWVGQPWEGFGSSGRPEYNFGSPSFDDTVFLLTLESKKVIVWMRYEKERQNNQNKRRTDQNSKP